MMMLIWLAGAAMACHWEKMERVFQSSRRLGWLLVVSFAAVYPAVSSSCVMRRNGTTSPQKRAAGSS
jgi:hypothetical protein